MARANGDRECRCGGSHLTRRQCEVLALVAAGLTVDQAAHRLGIAASTAEGHMRSMRQRAHARSSPELAARAFATGIFESGSWPPRLSGRLCVGCALPDQAR